MKVKKPQLHMSHAERDIQNQMKKIHLKIQITCSIFAILKWPSVLKATFN